MEEPVVEEEGTQQRRINQSGNSFDRCAVFQSEIKGIGIERCPFPNICQKIAHGIGYLEAVIIFIAQYQKFCIIIR